MKIRSSHFSISFGTKNEYGTFYDTTGEYPIGDKPRVTTLMCCNNILCLVLLESTYKRLRYPRNQRKPQHNTNKAQQKPNLTPLTAHATMRIVTILTGFAASVIASSAQDQYGDYGDYQDYADGYEQDSLYQDYAMRQQEKGEGGGG